LSVVFRVPKKGKKKCGKCTTSKCSKPKKTKKKKTKPKPKIGAVMDPTVDYYDRMDYVRRRTAWRWRMAPFIKEKNKTQCGSCQMNGRCHRVPLDEKITAKIGQGEECPDYKSMWEKIIGDSEPYDWGF